MYVLALALHKLSDNMIILYLIIKYALQKSLWERIRSNYFFDSFVKVKNWRLKFYKMEIG